MFAYLQRIGRSLMLPIAVLPAAGLLLRFGQPDLLNINWLADAGGAVFNYLPLLFAVGVAIGFTADIGTAGLAGVVCYWVLIGVVTDLGPVIAKAMGSSVAINTGVISGIVSGIVVASLYERFHEVKLPEWLAFFGGRRFVPIVAAFAGLVLGLIFSVVWPPIQIVLYGIGQWAGTNGAIGAAVHAFFNRLLIPFGLHHVLNTIVWFQLPPAAGFAPCLKDGKEVLGDLNRFFANCPGDPGIFMSGFFPIMLFGLPAAALAMYHSASDNGKKAVLGILWSAALTSFITGITEPIEFAFMFVAPVLYVLHAVLTAISAYIVVALGIRDGFTFSAGFIDYLLNFSNPSTHQPIVLLIIGVVFGVIYYVVFRWVIAALNIPTPGREPAEIEQELKEEGLAPQPAPTPSP
jgi:PTS system N-acetylglucosamine-specific IIC component